MKMFQWNIWMDFGETIYTITLQAEEDGIHPIILFSTRLYYFVCQTLIFIYFF